MLDTVLHLIFPVLYFFLFLLALVLRFFFTDLLSSVTVPCLVLLSLRFVANLSFSYLNFQFLFLQYSSLLWTVVLWFALCP